MSAADTDLVVDAQPKPAGFRAAMTQLHSWAGVVIGAILFAVFWFGTLTVFVYEIDRWMKPETRLPNPATTIDIDETFAAIRAANSDNPIEEVSILLPNSRKPYIQYFSFSETGGFGFHRLNPTTYESMPEEGSHGASGFLYPMHVMLYLPGLIGWWIVLFAALTMMMMLITGVVIHRKIIADFFTFRPQKRIRRSSLDLHNVVGTLFLPFHFLIVFSGLAVWGGFYASYPWTLLQNSFDIHTVELFNEADAYGMYPTEPELTGIAKPTVAIGPLVARAEAIWSERYGEDSRADRLEVHGIGDTNAQVNVYRSFPERRMEAFRDQVVFNGSSGALVMDYVPGPVQTARSWLSGLHLINFNHWSLRWLYFIAGLSGCLLIATGFVFWCAARQKKHLVTQPLNVRLVESLTIGSVLGVMLATATFFVANRVLPDSASWLSFDRAGLEVLAFFSTWLFAFVHAVARGRAAWHEQAWAISAACIAAVLLNALTTGDHPLGAIRQGQWAVAGMDIVLLAFAAIATTFSARVRPSGMTATRTARASDNQTTPTVVAR
ncbi:MAG: PepSY-associated TM helix domain-containing protein [Pseudomonadota bacterium]